MTQKHGPSHSAVPEHYKSDGVQNLLPQYQQALRAAEVDSYYEDREARPGKENSINRLRDRQDRQTRSLFSSLFLDKYLISGTLMGIDRRPYPLFIDPS